MLDCLEMRKLYLMGFLGRDIIEEVIFKSGIEEWVEVKVEGKGDFRMISSWVNYRGRKM